MKFFGQLNGKRFGVAPAFGAHVRPIIAHAAKPIKNQNLPTITQLNASIPQSRDVPATFDKTDRFPLFAKSGKFISENRGDCPCTIRNAVNFSVSPSQRDELRGTVPTTVQTAKISNPLAERSKGYPSKARRVPL